MQKLSFQCFSLCKAFFHSKFQRTNKKNRIATASRKFFQQKYSADLNFQFIISEGLFVCLPLKPFFILSEVAHTFSQGNYLHKNPLTIPFQSIHRFDLSWHQWRPVRALISLTVNKYSHSLQAVAKALMIHVFWIKHVTTVHLR